MSVYSSGLEMNIDFDKEKVNIYEIQKYLSGHVFVDSTEDLLAYNAPNPKQTFTREEAYKCGRDMAICTTKRMLYVDTKGFTGKKVEYLSLKYSCIKGYQVATAGKYFDRDAEFYIFTNISEGKKSIKNELRKGQCDV